MFHLAGQLRQWTMRLRLWEWTGRAGAWCALRDEKGGGKGEEEAKTDAVGNHVPFRADIDDAVVFVDFEMLGGGDEVEDFARSFVIRAQGDLAGDPAGDGKFEVSVTSQRTEDN